MIGFPCFPEMTMSPDSAIASHNQPFRLDLEDLPGLRAYLIQRGFADTGEDVAAEKAGDGNMNCVVRLRLPNRSLIVKQARPWVEKYPSIPAPLERASAEARFYRFTAENPVLTDTMPRLLGYDQDSALLILEDLTPASTLADCYQGAGSVDGRQLKELAGYTSALHRMAISSYERSLFRNQAMRRLNHEHIFDVPLRVDGALSEMLEGITPGLDNLAETFRHDAKFCRAVERLGRRYLEHEGSSLIHGDLFPGSVLLTCSGQLRVIDPEFSFCGDPEFDIGVFYAHLMLSCHPDDTAAFWLQVALEDTPYSKSLTLQYAGVEIMRRILGVAQLPVSLSLETKHSLLRRSREMVLFDSKVSE
jgi:5-methylthioribose kinase